MKFSPALRHIITNVIQRDQDEVLLSGLVRESIMDTHQLVDLDRDYDVTPLLGHTQQTSMLAQPVLKPIAPTVRIRLGMLQEYARQFLLENEKAIDDVDWLRLSYNDFRYFQCAYAIANGPYPSPRSKSIDNIDYDSVSDSKSNMSIDYDDMSSSSSIGPEDSSSSVQSMVDQHTSSSPTEAPAEAPKDNEPQAVLSIIVDNDLRGSDVQGGHGPSPSSLSVDDESSNKSECPSSSLVPSLEPSHSDPPPVLPLSFDLELPTSPCPTAPPALEPVTIKQESSLVECSTHPVVTPESNLDGLKGRYHHNQVSLDSFDFVSNDSMIQHQSSSPESCDSNSMSPSKYNVNLSPPSVPKVTVSRGDDKSTHVQVQAVSNILQQVTPVSPVSPTMSVSLHEAEGSSSPACSQCSSHSCSHNHANNDVFGMNTQWRSTVQNAHSFPQVSNSSASNNMSDDHSHVSPDQSWSAWEKQSYVSTQCNLSSVEYPPLPSRLALYPPVSSPAAPPIVPHGVNSLPSFSDEYPLEYLLAKKTSPECTDTVKPMSTTTAPATVPELLMSNQMSVTSPVIVPSFMSYQKPAKQDIDIKHPFSSISRHHVCTYLPVIHESSFHSAEVDDDLSCSDSESDESMICDDESDDQSSVSSWSTVTIDFSSSGNDNASIHPPSLITTVVSDVHKTEDNVPAISPSPQQHVISPEERGAPDDSLLVTTPRPVKSSMFSNVFPTPEISPMSQLWSDDNSVYQTDDVQQDLQDDAGISSTIIAFAASIWEFMSPSNVDDTQNEIQTTPVVDPVVTSTPQSDPPEDIKQLQIDLLCAENEWLKKQLPSTASSLIPSGCNIKEIIQPVSVTTTTPDVRVSNDKIKSTTPTLIDERGATVCTFPHLLRHDIAVDIQACEISQPKHYTHQDQEKIIQKDSIPDINLNRWSEGVFMDIFQDDIQSPLQIEFKMPDF